MVFDFFKCLNDQIFQKNGITTLKKHVDANHVILEKRFKEEVNSPLRDVLERQPAKKRPNVYNSIISQVFGAKDHFKKDVVQQKQILQDIALLVVKNHLLVQFIESTWLKLLVMHLCSRFVFTSSKIFSQEVLVDLVEKIKQKYVLPKLKQCYFATNFDLWMLKGACDVFTMVISFFIEKWQPQRITIQLFEANETTRHVMVKILIELLDQYDLRKKIITYVKGECANLNAMTIT